MRIAVVGAGYVGLVTATCLANLGNDVVCMDVDSAKIEKLRLGQVPFYEPGLRDLLEINLREGRLRFTLDLSRAVVSSDVVFIAVGTPSGDNGVADLRFVFDVAGQIAKCMDSYKVIIVKSTVPVGTGEQVRRIISEGQVTRLAFDVVSNPEFLREGEAINDFMFPDRIIIGVDNEASRKIMLDIYRPIERTGRPIIVTDVRSSELIKYVSNAMLAARISFMNELSHLCERSGADVKIIAKGVGLDSRIGPRFLQAGAGYGGSCFPKDVRALVAMMRENGCKSRMLEAVDAVNEDQKRFVAKKVLDMIGPANGKRVALWGLSFKPKTDDMREAPSLVLVSALQKAGASVSAFDPVAAGNAGMILKDVEFARNPYDAVKGADCLVVITEWDEFRELDKSRVCKLMRQPNLVDARNIYEPAEMRSIGFNYVGIGR